MNARKKSNVEEMVRMFIWLKTVMYTTALTSGQKSRVFFWWFAKPKRWLYFTMNLSAGMKFEPAYELTKRMKRKELVAIVEFSQMQAKPYK